MMIEDFFKNEKNAIDEELVEYFKKLDENATDPLFNDFLRQMREFVIPKNSRAKRLHPILTIAAFSGIVNPLYLEEELPKVRKVAIALELLHTGHLIHDDLIDDDESRRGKPSFHIQLRNEINEVYKTMDIAGKKELETLYGRDLSILGGAHGYLLGLDIIKGSKFPDNLKLMAISEYSEALEFLMKGQIIEEYMSYHNLIMSMEQYLSIAEMQRARLFEKAAKIGAILAKGNLHYQIKPLSEAMLRIGQAHAIRDDILDVKEDILGKKKKFIYILAVQNTNEEQSKLLNEIYHKPKITKQDLKKVEEIFTETNALIIAEHFSKNLIEQARSYLKDIYPDLNKEQKEFFNAFSDFIYMRDF
ncbi:MAG: polyprenyl synthetase family protein [Promethearchaeota archaeon]